MADGPAAKGGLESGDIVVAVDGRDVGTPGDLRDVVQDRHPGDSVKVAYLRNGERREARVELGEMPSSLRRMSREAMEGPVRMVRDLKLRPDRGWLGVVTQPLSGDLGEYFGAKDGGALVAEVTEDSPAAKLGLKAGDVIVRVDDAKIEDPGDLSREIRGHEKADQVEVTWVRDRKEKKGKVDLVLREAPMPRVFSWNDDDGDDDAVMEFMDPGDMGRHMRMFRHHVRGDEVESRDELMSTVDDLRAEIESIRRELEQLRDEAGD
jgi:C-terminal processing protease CtpA/Prc